MEKPATEERKREQEDVNEEAEYSQEQKLALKPPSLPIEEKVALPLAEQMMSTTTPK